MEISGPPIELLDLTMPDVLDRAPDGVAAVFGDAALSYTDLKTRSRAVAAGLIARGVAPGDRVALLIGNCPEFLIAQYGVLRTGAICVPLNTRLSAAEIGGILAHSGASLVIAQETLRGIPLRRTVEGLRESLPDLRHVVALDDTLGATARPDAPLPHLAPEDPAVLIYTSGTTGKPKGCLHAHRSFVNSAHVTAGLKGLTAADRIIASVPFFNAFGTLNCILEALHVGATIVVEETFEAGEALELIEREAVTVLLGTPTMWLRILEHSDFAAARVETLRTGIMAGARAPADLVRRWRELGCDVQLIYGLSEATSILANGRPTPGITVSIGADGALRARGFNQMLEYFRDPEITAERIRDGWLVTGDLAEPRADGAIAITGRADDMIIVGGFNVQPAEVEDALRSHPSVADAAAFGLDDRDLGQVVAAWVMARPGAAPDPAALTAHCCEQLARYKVPIHLKVVEEFPLTANGKVKRYQMREATERELTRS